jgi:hypothetical protein
MTSALLGDLYGCQQLYQQVTMPEPRHAGFPCKALTERSHAAVPPGQMSCVLHYPEKHATERILITVQGHQTHPLHANVHGAHAFKVRTID